MSTELDTLARWALDSYANNRDSEDAMLAPLLTIVGGDYDALTTVGDIDMGESAVESLSFLIGYVGYPCDAVYLTCTWEALSVEADVEMIEAKIIDVDNPPQDETTRTALLCWAHSIPTHESVLYMLNRHLDDEGGSCWHGLRAPYAAELPLFQPLADAAHGYDHLPIEPTAHAGRQAAMAVLINVNGDTHESLFYEPGTLLEAARNHHDKQTEGE